MPEDSANLEWEFTVPVRNGRPLIPVSITCPNCDQQVKRNPGTYVYDCSCGALTLLEVPRGDTRRRDPKTR